MTDPLDDLLQQTAALRSLARALVGDDLADDVLQEAALQTMAAPPRRAGPLGGWLARVVRNQALKQRRAAATRSRHEREAARCRAIEHREPSADVLVLRQLTDVVTGLPEPYRATILARFLREQTPTEIAAATDTPVATVKTRLQRGLELLRERLDGRADDWRGALVLAFALRGPTPLPNPASWYGTAPMKALLLCVLLVPFGLGLGLFDPSTWSPPPAPTPAGTPAPLADSTSAPAPADPLTRGGPSVPLAAPVSQTVRNDATSDAEAPLIRLEFAGPRAFRDAFAGTRVANLLAAEQAGSLWEPLQAPVEDLWRWLDGNREAGFDVTRQRVLDYTGRIHVLWMLDSPTDEEVQGPHADHFFGVVALEMDGASDLTLLAGDLARALRTVVPAPATTRQVGGHTLQQIQPGPDDFVTLPIVLGSHAVAFFGNGVRLEDAMPRALAALAVEREASAAPVALHIDLSRLQDLAEIRNDPPLVRAFGLESLRALDVQLRPAADRILLEADLEFGDGPRGLAAALMPAVHRLPALLSRIPADATPWLALPFRWDELYRVVADTADAFDADDDRAEPEKGLREIVNETLGFDLERELLDHVGGEMLLFGDLWRSEDAEEFEQGGAPPLGACLAVALRDTPAFQAGFDQLLDHFRSVVRRHETREVDGVRITRLGTWFLTGTQLAVGQDLAALAFGPESVTQLEDLVTGRPATGTAGLSPTSVPDDVRHVQHLAPAGWNGIGLVDLGAFCAGQAILALEALDEAWPQGTGEAVDPEAVQSWLASVLPLLTEHGLTRLVGLTGYEGAAEGAATWRMRIAW